MKKQYLFLAAFLIFNISNAQNVGIGTTTPSEKLDVSGNVNVTGTIKANGIDGTPGQVLMKNTIGNLAWGETGPYKNVIAINQSLSWTVPANVTDIFVEAWGGGGGGAYAGGGAGGTYAYESAKVSPGESVSITIGTGGTASSSQGGTATDGQNTIVFGSLFSITSRGGGGANASAPGYAGIFSTSAPFFVQFSGQPGQATSYSYSQAGSGVYYEVRNYGSGGGSAPYYNNGGRGGVQVINLGTAIEVKRTSTTFASFPGGGGGGGYTGTSWGTDGSKGEVIIHY